MPASNILTTGNIFISLNRFALPVMLALLLQALYGGVDLFIVGRFGTTADISGVASGGLMLQTITDFVSMLAIGVTITVGQLTGARKTEEAEKSIYTAICLFAILGFFLTVAMTAGNRLLSTLLQAPAESFSNTSDYIFYCGTGMIFMVAYNLLAAVFRGLGDSKTPLFAVTIACILNIGLDLLFVAHLHQGAAGAAIATSISQGFSVAISLFYIQKCRKKAFFLSLSKLRLYQVYLYQELKLGIPLAIQDFMVSISFLAIQIIVNGIDVASSAAVGIGEKLCLFLMLVPIAYSQAISAFVAQNIGACHPKRALKSMFHGMISSLCFGIIIAAILLFKADLVAGLFTHDPQVIQAAVGYLHSYGLDCLCTPFLFCFFGYFTGRGNTFFVAIQGIIGAIGIRITVALLARHIGSTSLFAISLGSPLSSFFQILICLSFFLLLLKQKKLMVSPANCIKSDCNLE